MCPKFNPAFGLLLPSLEILLLQVKDERKKKRTWYSTPTCNFPGGVRKGKKGTFFAGKRTVVSLSFIQSTEYRRRERGGKWEIRDHSSIIPPSDARKENRYMWRPEQKNPLTCAGDRKICQMILFSCTFFVSWYRDTLANPRSDEMTE